MCSDALPFSQGDLSAKGISGKLKSYANVAKFLKDVKNILGNCREYNEEVEGDQGQVQSDLLLVGWYLLLVDRHLLLAACCLLPAGLYLPRAKMSPC